MHRSLHADAILRSLAMTVARNAVGANKPIKDVIAGEGLTLDEYVEISENPLYRKLVDAYTHELTENGYGFSAKARVLAEDLLPDVYRMARDEDVPAPVRMKGIENLVEWGELKPQKGAQVQAAGSGFGINIIFGDKDGNKVEVNVSAPDDSSGTDTDVGDIIDVTPEAEPIGIADERVGTRLGKHTVHTDMILAEDEEYAGEDVYV